MKYCKDSDRDKSLDFYDARFLEAMGKPHESVLHSMIKTNEPESVNSDFNLSDVKLFKSK